MKRGVELSMNVVVIAALAMIVLVVLVLLITGAIGPPNQQQYCSSLETGQCVPLADGESCAQYFEDSAYTRGAKNCPTEGDTCCFKPLG